MSQYLLRSKSLWMVREGLDLWRPAVEFMLRAEYIKVSFLVPIRKIFWTSQQADRDPNVVVHPVRRKLPLCRRSQLVHEAHYFSDAETQLAMALSISPRSSLELQLSTVNTRQIINITYGIIVISPFNPSCVPSMRNVHASTARKGV